MPPVHSAEADAFAIAMIVVMICGLGVIALIIGTVFRNAAKRSNEIDELIEEASREDAEAEKAPVTASREPWEKDGDWWKK